MIAAFGDNVHSEFVDTPEQATDYAAQNPRWALMMLVFQMLKDGVDAVFPPGTSVTNVETNNNAPNDAIS